MTPDSPETPAATPAIPRTLGIVHLVYGALLILASLVWGGYLIGIPMMFEFISATVQQRNQATAASNAARIAELSREIEAAEDEAKQDELREEKTRLEVANENPETFEFPTLGLSSPRASGTLAFEVFSGILLYFLMMIAGIGLLKLRRWGRGLAIGVAVVKIAQVVLVAGLHAALLAPAVAEGTRTALVKAAEVDANDPPADDEAGPEAAPAEPSAPEPSPDEIAGQIVSAIYVNAAGSLLFGLIYPLVTIALLNRPAVRAAFDPAPALAEGLTP